MIAALASRQHALDARIGFLGDGRIQGRQRIDITRFDHRLRCREAQAWIGRYQGERAECRFNGAAQTVVDAHRLEIGGGALSQRRQSRRR